MTHVCLIYTAGSAIFFSLVSRVKGRAHWNEIEILSLPWGVSSVLVSRDVTAAMLVSMKNEATAGLVYLNLASGGPVVQNPINANPRLKINQGVYSFAPKYCSNADIRQIFTSRGRS